MRLSPEQRSEPEAGPPTGSRPHAIAVQRPARWPIQVAVLLTASVLIALVKPWAWLPLDPAGVDPSFVPVATTAGPTATRDTTAEGIAAPFCLGAGAWRIASLERWPQDVRVWRAIDPSARASGPQDARIVRVPIVAVEVHGLGWCAPVTGDRRPVGPITVTGWRIDAGRAISIPLRRIEPVEGETPLGAIYAAPDAPDCRFRDCDGSADGEAGWPAGRYVFRYDDIGSGDTLWIEVDVATLGAVPSVAPGRPSPTPSSTSAPPAR